jgi:hypothetical protein
LLDSREIKPVTDIQKSVNDSSAYLHNESLTSTQKRREGRYQRRCAKRLAKKQEQQKDCTLEKALSIDELYISKKEAANGVSWKRSTQVYLDKPFYYIMDTKNKFDKGINIHQRFNEFSIMERGKKRDISAVPFYERVVHKSVSTNILVPTIGRTFIPKNSANLKGRGTDYAVRCLKEDMRRYYQKYGNEGYVLLIDFSNYFANINHDAAKQLIAKNVLDEDARNYCYQMIDDQGEIGLGLGSEPNQVLAVGLPGKIDHYVQEVLRSRYYGRYMDDSYLIAPTKEELKIALKEIQNLADELKIIINTKKTKIMKLSKGFTFLKKRFFYSETGKIIITPCKKSITRERQKLKKQYKTLYLNGIMTYEDIKQSYMAWRGSLVKYNSYYAIKNMDNLFFELFPDAREDKCFK